MDDRTSQTSCTAAVRTDLEEISRAVEGTFTRAANALLSGRENVGILSDALGRYCAGLLEFAESDVPQTVELLASRFAEADTAHDRESRTIDRLVTALEKTGAPLVLLHDTVRMIDFFSSTARVIETETDFDGNLAFSSEIKTLSLRSHEAYLALIAQRDDLLGRTARIRASQDGFARASLAHLAELGAALQGLSAGLRPRLRMAATASETVVKAVERAADEMSRGISALQVGDSFRQRLEHVAAALGPCLPDPDASPMAHALVLRIAAAQLAGAGKALDDDLTRLAAVLNAASRHSGQFAGWGDALSGESEVAPLLEELRDRCGVGLAALYSSQVQLRAIERQLRDLRSAIQDMNDVIARLGQIDGDMRRGSLNVFLRSQRACRNGPAMMFVARQFGELTDTCSDAQARIVDELRQIREITSGSVGQGQDRVGQELSQIGDKLAGLSDVLGLWRDLRSDLHGLLDRGPQAVADFTDCAREVTAQRAVARRIATLARRLSPGPAPPPDSGSEQEAEAAADVLRTLYSVPEEREIHDRICPPSRAAQSSVPKAAATVAGAAADDGDFEWF